MVLASLIKSEPYSLYSSIYVFLVLTPVCSENDYRLSHINTICCDSTPVMNSENDSYFVLNKTLSTHTSVLLQTSIRYSWSVQVWMSVSM